MHDTRTRLVGRERRWSAGPSAAGQETVLRWSDMAMPAGMTIVQRTVSGDAALAVHRDVPRTKGRSPSPGNRAICGRAPLGPVSRDRPSVLRRLDDRTMADPGESWIPGALPLRVGNVERASEPRARTRRVEEAPPKGSPAPPVVHEDRSGPHRIAPCVPCRDEGSRPERLRIHSCGRAAQTDCLCEHLVAVSRERQRSRSALAIVATDRRPEPSVSTREATGAKR